ncbi:AraC family transcriptional regulator [Dyadobacter sp. 676]|uniref:AraC family transcriptional regulator n=1 Tax=Dyadobacter sp. 676 TaxID=3088362 RepID=A0AAU8FPL6_9BACT
MKIVFRSEEFAELNFERGYSEGFGVDERSGIRETRYEYSHPGMHSRMHRIYCPGMICSMIEGELDRDLVQILESDFPYLQMHFELSTTGCLYIPEAKSEIETVIYGGSHSLLFYPALKGRLYYLKKPMSRSVEIELSLDFLRRLFHDDLEVLQDFGKNIEKNHPAVMGNRSFPITPEMNRLLAEIRDCPYTGSLKKLFVEARVVELLILQISQINAAGEEKSRLKRSDIDKLHEVKDLLLRNINDPFSIEELARVAGLNRTKLQEGFKELFGTTVFGYITDTRLEEARRHLLNTDSRLSIGEIAALSGYKNPQHFTAAFKKKFGYLPRDARR